MRLPNKVAIITGAASGIGEQTAYRFAEEGAIVAVVDINARGAATVQQRIIERGQQALAFPVDVSIEEQVRGVVDTMVQRYSRIDILFNNAGIGFSSKGRYKMTSVVETPVADWDAIVAINLRSVFLFCKYTVPVMQTQKSGSIINNSSIMALKGWPGADAYTAAKGGIITLTRSMAIEHGPAGIRVNCICPGSIHTPIQGELLNDEAYIAEMNGQIPLRRIGDPVEVANLVVFLGANESSYITGAIIPIDGGLSA